MPRPLSFRRGWTSDFATLFFLLAALIAPFALWFSFVLSPLQRQYVSPYVGLAVNGSTARTAFVWWIWKTAPKRKPELAMDADVVPAPYKTLKGVPLALSPMAQAKGWTGLIRAQQVGRTDGEAVVLREHFFVGQSVARLMVTPV